MPLARWLLLGLLLCGAAVADEELEGRVKTLLADLAGDDEAVHPSASRDLQSIGAPAIPFLAEALKTNDAALRARLTPVLFAIRFQASGEPSAWVTLPEGDVPVLEALESVSEQAGLEFRPSAPGLEGKALHLTGARVSLWEAVDQLTDAGGCDYRHPLSKGVVLVPQRGPRPPTCHTPPYRFLVGAITREAARDLGTGQTRTALSVQIHIQSQPGMAHLPCLGPVRVELAEDDQGTRLSSRGQESGRALWGDARGGPSELEHSGFEVLLSTPGPAAKGLARLAGSIDVLFRREWTEIVFDDARGQVGESREVGGLRAELREVRQEGESVTVSVRLEGLDWLKERLGSSVDASVLTLLGSPITLSDASGKHVGSGGAGGSAEGGLSLGAVGRLGPKERLEVRCGMVSRVYTRTVRFEFRDVPLP